MIKAKLQQAISSYSSTSTDTMRSPRPTLLLTSRPPAQLSSPPELKTRVRFYKNFIPLICQMNGLRICTSFWPKTMVDTQKLHHMAGHLIMWSYDTKKTTYFEKKDKYNGHVASHVCLATWIAYADDTQLYATTEPDDVSSVRRQLGACTTDVAQWCASRRLQLNADKTEAIWIASRASLNKVKSQDCSLVMGAETVTPADVVRNLGVYLDSELSMKQHVAKVASICFFHLRRLR